MKWWKVPVVLLGCAGGFGIGFFLRDVSAGRAPSGAALAAFATNGNKPTPTEVFQRNYDTIIRKYARSVDPTNLRYAAMQGAVSSLGDPHTSFLEPVVADRFAMETHGDFVGVGARLSDDPQGAKVAVVFKNSPASRAGLKVNDVIVQVDDNKVAGWDTDKIVKHVKGEAGTVVHLTIQRPGVAGLLKLQATRAQVFIPTAEAKVLDGNIGYISVATFAENTPGQFDDALQELMNKKTEGLVIDLRSNPGGLLNAASAMLGRFAESKQVVTMKLRGGHVVEEKSPAGSVWPVKGPVVILINEESASASEIFASDMRHWVKAKLVGEHTYGKMSVQTVHTIPQDMASLKVTIARYFVPSGEDYSRKVDDDGAFLKGGIVPDYPVELDYKPDTMIGDPAKDNQLAKAIQVLKGNPTEPPPTARLQARIERSDEAQAC
ncbi:MAG: S41 family peptidase [Armatimonadetes bacterium]|nr:S41 family peptidase [Armatimonadota bacterium]